MKNLFLVGSTVFLFLGCSLGVGKTAEKSKCPNIDAAFLKTYKLNFECVLTEQALLASLTNHEVKYDMRGPDSELLKTVPKPSKNDNFDNADIAYAYVIYGLLNQSKNRKEDYIAYISKDKNVSYLEKRYAYFAP